MCWNEPENEDCHTIRDGVIFYHSDGELETGQNARERIEEASIHD